MGHFDDVAIGWGDCGKTEGSVKKCYQLNLFDSPN